MDWTGVDYCDVFIRLSFWRHPFTAEHPLMKHWCRGTFPQRRNKLILIWDGLRVSTFSFSQRFSEYIYLYCIAKLFVVVITDSVSQMTSIAIMLYLPIFLKSSLRWGQYSHFLTTTQHKCVALILWNMPSLPNQYRGFRDSSRIYLSLTPLIFVSLSLQHSCYLAESLFGYDQWYLHSSNSHRIINKCVNFVALLFAVINYLPTKCCQQMAKITQAHYTVLWGYVMQCSPLINMLTNVLFL